MVKLTAVCGFGDGEVRRVNGGRIGRCNEEPVRCSVLICLCKTILINAARAISVNIHSHNHLTCE
jgi:hypothetical protein